MSDVIDLNEFRNGPPDKNCVMVDDDGVQMFLFALEYEFAGGRWATEMWAYSAEDAQSRVEAMKESLSVLGQTYSVIPA